MQPVSSSRSRSSWIRWALANTITRHGVPGSETRAALRSIQAASVASPTHATLVQVLAGRLDRYPLDGGLPAVDPIAEDVADGEAGEIGALATPSGLRIRLVEEVAADIFMGTFTAKWRDVAEIASRALAGTLYTRYYDLPDPAFWSQHRPGATLVRRWGEQTAADFAELCTERAKEAQAAGGAIWVARNGTVLEQSQILTTHNMATLIEALDLGKHARQLATDLADRILDWVVRRQAQPCPDRYAALQMIKNTAYAWRQAVFFLSLCDEQTQHAAVIRLQVAWGSTHRWSPGRAAGGSAARATGRGKV
jgi:hypothetical protein